VGDWHSFDGGKSIGRTGNEAGGKIVRDEEHDEGARITLESDCEIAPCAITANVYEWMLHIRALNSLAEGEAAYDEMKKPLIQLAVMIKARRLSDPSAVPTDLIMKFTQQFP
jgi:hypothetical protein